MAVEADALPPRVLVYDPDGVNFYGREVAALLAEAGIDTELVIALDIEWEPDGVLTRRLLPGNRGGRSKGRQLESLVRSLVATWQRCFRTGTALLVAWTRSPLEDLVLSTLALVGTRVVVVAHNPVPRQKSSVVRRLSQHALLRASASVVAHSDSLAEAVRDRRHRDVVVCPIPPPLQWVRRWVVRPDGDRATSAQREVNLLFFGQLRSDKSVNLLPEILRLVDPGCRKSLGLTVAGRGKLPQGLAEDVRSLGVRFDDRTSETFLSDVEVASLLAGADLLVAPYAGATQSASVALAVTAGLPVLAFAAGALSELVADDGLVPTMDLAAFARRLEAAVDGEMVGRPRRSVDAWRADARARWSAVVPGPALEPRPADRPPYNPLPDAGLNG